MKPGFSILEIIMAVGLALVLVLVAYPGWKRSDQRSQAERIRKDLEQIAAAVMKAADSAADPTALIPFEEYSKHLPAGNLKKTGQDPFGNPYGPQSVSQLPTVPKAAAERLKGIVPDSFWRPFPIAPQ